MKHIVFYLDFVSPYAYLAFERLPVVLEGLSYAVTYRPVFLGPLLRQRGQKAPVDVPPKREWIYRQALWLARAHGVPMEMPALHPFDSLPLLRLALARAGDGTSNRFVTGAVLRHVWQGGGDPLAPDRLQALAQAVAPAHDPQDAQAKQLLRANTDEAAALGVFGVPTMVVDGRLFWGLDALPMLRDYLGGDAWFDGPGWTAAAHLPSGLH
ncbi:2-hydroxychromene-2-carboxylate isomerase [Ramlibacter sp. H39-3-26]|uniref:2-hydroxychromene-2-carboxylate isomerase n=1 Tax=Curvibacter soli TaxID=3031331 RepID=UPI0023D9E465|nr:2-hydroxychromene-2-carboxylate isomerase [Ramlibacter sp. H39-3-26]MDF1484474.1 2-hydroxychromene-2-carboxylate isomerase [Ramlibacter sp. H39-3-26]